MSHRQLTADARPAGAGEPWVPGASQGWSARWRTTWGAVRLAVRRHRSRRYLGQLDARALKDLGITFAEAEAEANKPFWRS